jgi:DNA-binding protein HU-beta
MFALVVFAIKQKGSVMAKVEESALGKQDLVNVIAEKGEITKAKAAEIYDAMSDVIVEALKHHKTVRLQGVGNLVVKTTSARPERAGRNPLSGEVIKIKAKPAAHKVALRVTRELKASLAKATKK